MQPLQAGQTFRGVAGTAAAVTCTVEGDEVSSSGDAFGVLDQRVLPNSVTTLYTVPASTFTLIGRIWLSNTTASVVTGIKFFVGGSAAGNQVFVLAIPALGSAIYGDKGWTVYDQSGTPVSTQFAASIIDFNTAVRLNRIDQLAAAGANVDFGGFQGINAADPITPQSLVTKAYVDNLIAALPSQPEVNYATTAPLPAVTYANGTAGVGATLTANAVGVLTVDGVALGTLGTAVLVQNQVAPAQNGIYTLTTVGTAGVAFVLTRRATFDTASEMGSAVLVPVDDQGLTPGGTNDDKVFLSITASPFVVGTTGITFQLIGSTYSADGTSITLSGTQFSRAALTGMVTAPAGSSVTTIAAGVVTNAMLAGSIAYSKLVLSGSVVNADIANAAAITYSKLSLVGQVVNADVAGAAAIAYSKLNLTGSVVNADVATAAAIAYSKLALSGSVVNADISGGAAIAYGKLALTGSIVNTDVSNTAAITYAKLSLGASIVNADIATGAAIAYAKLNLTGLVVNADIAAAAAIARSKLDFGSGLVNADISNTAAIGYSKLSLVGQVVNADIAGAAAIVYSKLSLTGGIINADISASAAIVYSKLSLAASIVNADISGGAAIAYGKLALTGSVVNTDISNSAAIAYSKLSLGGQVLNSDISNSAAIALSKLAAQNNNTFVANISGGSAVPTAITVAQAKTTLAYVDSDIDYTEAASQVVGTQANFNINLNRFVFNLLNYIGAGFVADNGDGTTGTDVGAPMNTILGLLATAKGGRLVIPGGLLMRQTTPIVVNGNGIEIIGGGCGYTSDTGNWRDALGTAFVWRGTSGQIQMDVFPPGTGGVGQNLKGFCLEGVSFEGRDNRTSGGDVGSTRADKGLRLRSCAGFHVRDIFAEDCVTAHIELGVLAAGTIGESHDCARGILERFCIRALDGGGAGGTVAPGTGLLLGGSSTANTNFNEIKSGQISYSGSNTGKPGMDLVNTDSNRFSTVAVNNAGGTSNWGIVVRGGASAAEASRANRFDNVSGGSAGMILCGTAGGQRPDGTADVSFNFTAPSGNNMCDMNTENGEPHPFLGTGVVGPAPGCSGGSSFPTQGFRSGSSALKTIGPIAAITTTEARIIGMTIPKWMLYAGRVLRLRAFGVFSNTATASTWTFRIRVGPTTLTGNVAAVDTGVSGVLARTNVPFMVEGTIIVPTAGAAGTVIGGVNFVIMAGSSSAVGNMPAKSAAGVTAAVAVNTLIANEVELTGIGATGTPTFTIETASIEMVN